MFDNMHLNRKRVVLPDTKLYPEELRQIKINKQGRVEIPADIIRRCEGTKGGAVRKAVRNIRFDSKKDVWNVYATEESIGQVNRIYGCSLDLGRRNYKKLIYPFKLKPFKHQKEALSVCGGREAFGYFMQPGTGKTKVTIEDIQILHKEGKVDTVSIVCPKSVMYTWYEEIKKHAYHEIWSIYVWNTLKKEYVCVHHNEKASIRAFIINYHGLVQRGVSEKAKIPNDLRCCALCVDDKCAKLKKWDFACEKFTKDPLKIDVEVRTGKTIKSKVSSPGFIETEGKLLSSIKTMMVLDESTAIKNRKSLTTTNIMGLRKYTAYRRCLTGTPSANIPIDLYAQFNFLDSAICFDWNYKTFEDHFCHKGGFKNKQITGFKNKDQLQAMLKNCGYLKRLEDCEGIDMPDRIYQERPVILSPKEEKAYNSIVMEIETGLLDKTITAQAVITKIIKCRQISGGMVIDDEKNLVEIGSSKINELMEVIAEIGDAQSIIWCQFTNEIVKIKEDLREKGISCTSISGADSAEKSNEKKNAFNDGSIQHIVIQNDAGSMGLTLNAATYAIFFSNSGKPDTRKQAEKRNYRIGQDKKTCVIDIYAEGTIDQSLIQLNKNKTLLSDQISGFSNLEDPVGKIFGLLRPTVIDLEDLVDFSN